MLKVTDSGCAAWCIHHLISLRQHLGFKCSPTDPLFVKLDGSAYSTADIKSVVRSTAVAAGIDPAMKGAHSLRIGGATHIFEQGGSPDQLKAAGRWDGDLASLYMRVSKHTLHKLNSMAFRSS